MVTETKQNVEEKGVTQIWIEHLLQLYTVGLISYVCKSKFKILQARCGATQDPRVNQFKGYEKFTYST